MTAALSPEGVGLTFVVSRGAVPRLATVVELMVEDEVLSRMPWTFMCTEDNRLEVQQAVGERPVEIDTIPDEHWSTIVAAVLADVETASQPATVPVILPKAREVVDLSEAVVEVISRLGDVAHGPNILLPVSLAPKGVIAEFIRGRLTSGRGLDIVTRTLIEESSMLTSNARIEFVDPAPSAIRVGVWLGQVLPIELPESTWSFEVALLSGTKVVGVSEPAPLRQRLDRFGDARWDELVAEIPVADVPTGNYTLGIRVVGLSNREFARLRARKGALAAARVRTVPEHGPTATSYLLNSAPRGATMYLSVDRGPSSSVAERWDKALLRKDLNFILRGRASRQLRRLRLQRLLTRRRFRGRDIWLVGERPDTAQDNGAALFRHLRTAHPERESYYVIAKDSPQRERLEGLGNVIEHSSRKHRLLMLHASVLANSNSINHMIPTNWDARDYEKHLAWRVGALRIYLKHGVHLSPNAVKRGLSGYDLVLAATHGEAAALQAVSGYESQVAKTGLPRYDSLEPIPATREVLFMSTWRRYLVPMLFGKGDGEHEPFEGSAYESFVGELLTSRRLADMLERYDYRLNFVPHYNLAQQVAQLPTIGDRITIGGGEGRSIQDQLRSCDAFITDYSSVHFDVAYVGTPIIYSRFDEEDYETRHASPSWFDYDRDGFGPVARTLKETLDALEVTLAGGCVVAEPYAARADASFVHRDHDNCARVVQEVDALLEGCRRD